MKAKTYKQFIFEAYIDSAGELQDFEAPGEDSFEYQILDQAHIIQEYLEESGALQVRLKIEDPIIKFTFKYIGFNYLLTIDLDSEKSKIETILGSNTDPVLVYSDSTDSLFNLFAVSGLEFLRY